MTLADSHVKNLLKEGTARAGTPPSGTEWRIAPEAVAAAKAKAEDYLRKLGEEAAKNAADGKRSTLKAEDVREPEPAPAAPPPPGPSSSWQA